MKLKNVAWFEAEIEKLAQSIKQHNECYANCQIRKSDLGSCKTYRSLAQAAKSDFSRQFYSVSLALSLLLGLLAKWNSFWPLLRPSNNPDCIVALPDSVQNAFVPLNQCDFCRNLTSIDHVHHLSPDDFTKK